MYIFPPYTLLLIILRIMSVRTMSFDLPHNGHDASLASYLDNINDDVSTQSLNCDGNGSSGVTVMPLPYLGCTTGGENMDDRDRGRDWDRNTARDLDKDRNKNRDRDNCDSCDSDMFNSRLKATHIAQNAAQVAKAANDAQAAAAHDASRQAKMQLAEKAISAARAADAVLEGKQAMVDNYAREIRDAEEVVGQVRCSLEISETNVEAAVAVVKAAELQAESFRVLVQQTSGTLSEMEGLIDQANVDIEEKNLMLAAAKARGDRLARQVAQAKSEYEQVREAACRAASAAVEAKQKVSSAALLCKTSPHRPPNACGYSLDRNTCNALLDLYRQRRRHQQRLRRKMVLNELDRYQGHSLYGDHSY
ncbi:uncharacterized protein LOC117148652 [Drosophila mauritiana]|uniref:Uncharacterized protein LOC117148652 n=1 Tax=Drosophila mauritiana TaxID=7226 RepID=A0A6P8KPR3_DROMA|nr:uncharacterized protein LOC117148652 [Drosophila mauritiana]